MSFHSPDALRNIEFLSVGKNVRFSTRASIYAASRILLRSHSRIDDFCVLSSGEGTAVAALSLVMKDLEFFGIYVDLPLKRMKSISRRLLELEKLYKEGLCPTNL